MYSLPIDGTTSHWGNRYLWVGPVSQEFSGVQVTKLDLPLVKDRGDTGMFDGILSHGNGEWDPRSSNVAEADSLWNFKSRDFYRSFHPRVREIRKGRSAGETHAGFQNRAEGKA